MKERRSITVTDSRFCHGLLWTETVLRDNTRRAAPTCTANASGGEYERQAFPEECLTGVHGMHCKLQVDLWANRDVP